MVSWLLLLLVGVAAEARTPTASAPRLLDDFESAAPWTALSSNQVSASLRETEGVAGRALCLDYDFNGVSGHAAMRRTLPLDFPANYAFDFKLRGSGPANQFEFKLIDASGDNVWWVNTPKMVFPSDWSDVRYKARHIRPAWGPLLDKTLRRTQSIEFTVYANEGGRGSLCVDSLRFGERPLPPDTWPTPRVTATSGEMPGRVLAPDAVAPWRSAAGGEQALTLDFGLQREFGGIVLDWAPGAHATRYAIALSDDARTWREVRSVVAANGGRDFVQLAESEARYLRLTLHEGVDSHYALRRLDIRDLAFGATANSFFEAVAASEGKALFPRAFGGEQTYWTVVGIDGGADSGLLSEDGTLEVARGGFSVMPFVLDAAGCNAGDARVSSWANVAIRQSLPDGYLPMPRVHWTSTGAVSPAACGSTRVAARSDAPPPWSLDIETFAQGSRDTSRLAARYTVRNDSDSPRTLTLALAVQPFQVNPPVQFLTTPGGVSPIHALAWSGAALSVDGRERVRPLDAPTQAFVTAFDAGMAAQRLRDPPTTTAVEDATGFASGALLYRIDLPPHGERSITLDIPLSGEPPRVSRDADWFETQRRAVADGWRNELDRVRLTVPPHAQALADTVRTSLAYILVNRDGDAIRPGTRSYARSWIRDGAMTSEALLRLGRDDAARDFLDWYAPYQFDDGKVPCCVDARGSDPVAENDSHGELVFLATEVARYTGDTALAQRMWPPVDAATRYMDRLRASERTDANRGTERFGLLPPSISHEGYSAKPAYSHWDNFWGLIGYKNAVLLAQMLERDDDAARLSREVAAFRADILASLAASAKKHDIDFIPGAADLGDFDATSTTIALSPGGEIEHLPPQLLRNTFERYWREFVARRDGTRAWKDYTPYEWRNVSAFVRLGWRERAHEAIAFFFDDRRPAAWNHWAEVVGRLPRESRFIGDMPHGWVASDFIRAALDLFAFERDSDRSLVLAAGIPADWLGGDGIGIDGLRTPYGTLSYTLRRDADSVTLRIGDGLTLPPGGVVIAWPLAHPPRIPTALADKATWADGELRIGSVPVELTLTLER
ncbi:discoidin domain-containing protein [Chiayiivirga flava]|uniref:F5/8 type C domain-containing protein n=1 Tax=Chiayiivirga flava TaxID=659595 RepID=A0A7W8D7X6_9GAMM|nr:discoidin domain-containing protein [Chiayiivirga flava]MBB5209548.1 hypothetical protein [Chiayiivirga flava]